MMFQHQISEMITRLIVHGVIGEPDRRKAHEAVAAYWEDRIAITWSTEDVLCECPGLTEDDARAVLQQILHHQSADQGITWDVIRTRATNMFGEKARSAAE